MTNNVLPTRERGVESQRARGRARATLPRHPVDLVRAVLGLAVLGLGFLVAQRGELPVFERDLFQIVNDLPVIIAPVVWSVMQLGNIVAAPALAAVAGFTKRFRLARDLLVSGLLAYLGADLVKSVVGRERPGGFVVEVNFPEGPVSGLGFVSGHSAVAAALATAAVPYLSRRGRRVAWGLAWAVGLGRIYVGAHLPLDVLGGLALGWAIGSVVHWLFGVQRRHVATERVDGLLRRFGLEIRGLRPTGALSRSSHLFEGVESGGRRVYVRYLEPDRLERDWLYRLWRLVAIRDIKDADAVAPLHQQAEHEAVAAMTARERGVSVPPVVLARGDSRGAVVVQEYVIGRALDELPAAELTAELLGKVWQQVNLLRAARVAHHDLGTSNVLVDSVGRPWVVAFGNAATGANDDALAGDVAELMVSLALCGGDVRLIADSAVDTLGPDPVAVALPRMAPLTLAETTRTRLRADPSRLETTRRVVRCRLGLPDADRPEFPPAGVIARGAVAAGAALALVGVPLLGGAAALLESVERGGWRWVGAAMALAILARVAVATASMLTVDRRIAVGRTYGAGLVADSATLLHGRDGWRRSGARFLERAGVLPADSRRSIDRFMASSIVAAVMVAVVAAVLAMVGGSFAGLGVPDALIPALLLGVGAWLLVLVGQGLARRGGTTPAAHSGVASALREIRGGRLPAPSVARRGGALLSWSAGGVALEAATLVAALHAVGGPLPLVATVSIYAGLHLMWSLLPVTAAPGAADVALLLALTAFGAPLAGACAAVAVFRLFTYWIPVTAGFFVSARSEHRFGR